MTKISFFSAFIITFTFLIAVLSGSLYLNGQIYRGWVESPRGIQTAPQPLITKPLR